MANQWLRLWHGLPQDPKFRTIARVSGEPISLVISMYICLLDSASQNVTRGHANVTIEDIASNLDVTEEQASKVFEAMQGRVLEDFYLSGWDVRQVKKEDAGSAEGHAKSAAQRKREERERKKLAAEKDNKSRKSQECHEVSRDVTTDKDKDKDKDKELKKQLCIRADELIEYLNLKAEKNYRNTDANREPILARFSDGFTMDDCKKVIDTKCEKWKGGDMDKYLRCETLFQKKKFDGYLNELPQSKEISIGMVGQPSGVGPRSTRDISLEENLTDRSWAN